ncbi:MAG: hypothetical protein F2749_11660 [Actinobacteria bacterium]|nr:hypothetical protein [Actinomycetota bacterium]MTB19416.1 hypothetical protein [Actinomycetota bacterium]
MLATTAAVLTLLLVGITNLPAPRSLALQPTHTATANEVTSTTVATPSTTRPVPVTAAPVSAAVVAAPVVTTTPETTPVPANNDGLCTQQQVELFLHTLLDPHGIAIPAVTMLLAGSHSTYKVGAGLIKVATCTTHSIAAHEVGHYVMDLANGYDFGQHKSEAAAYFTGAHWIHGNESYPGIEYAAHCVGNQLYGNGAYTKCPDTTMAAYARAIINRAAG